MIPSFKFASQQGMDVSTWMAFRRELLLSVGASIDELRRAG